MSAEFPVEEHDLPPVAGIHPFADLLCQLFQFLRERYAPHVCPPER
jgi:hypothetical protein